jgi:beta-fructofuranosidase
MLDLAEDWVWDFWNAHDGERHHAFFLKAPRTLEDPERRHTHARVGHAVSSDLVSWTMLPDALHPQPEPAFDDLATWTGSVVRDDDGLWWMFTSGITRRDRERLQRIGAATSRDLVTWERTDLVLEADPRWYAAHGDATGEVHWRDPFVVRDTAGLWHLYATAKVYGIRGNGVVAHATSSDLHHWEVGPPLAPASGRFDQLEVVSLAQVDGQWDLIFSCLGTEMPDDGPGQGGVWSVPIDGPGAPVDLSLATRLTSEDLYVGRAVWVPDGWRFLAFVNRDEEGAFQGGLTDPIHLARDSATRRLVLRGAPDRWMPSADGPGEPEAVHVG